MRIIASQKLPRDSRESIFAARHQDVSQGPLGFQCLVSGACPVTGNRISLGRIQDIEKTRERQRGGAKRTFP